MRIITLNLNGIRAAARKGVFEWLADQDADVICFQETKAQVNTTADAQFELPGYQSYFHDAEKKGYSGTGIYTRRAPDKVEYGLGWDCPDQEGRYVQVDIGDLSIASIYLPSGSSGDERQAIKFDFMDHYLKKLKRDLKKGREWVICGDWNIVHKEIDIKNFKSNQKHSGCLPEERAWIDSLFNNLGYVDAFRVVNKENNQYTWWSNRGQSWAKNVGWRIDYQVVTPGLADKIVGAAIYKDQRFSDHAPLIIDYRYDLC